MKRIIICLVLLTTACAPKPVTITTPQGATAYTADQIVVRINELENAVIAANQQNQLPVATTRAIVTFCVDADATLGQTPAGWLATVKTAWTQTKSSLPTVTNPAVIAAMSAVDTVLGVVR